jgi:ABC-type polysaccharide/polyol phosphate export permease
MQSLEKPALTGDESHVFLFIGLLVVGIVGIILSIRILTKNRKKPR